MARTRSFDDTAVLDAAVAEFRLHGYADTSTEQLCEAAGVKRSSLYNAFISKDELFIQALERYVSVTSKQQETILVDDELDGAGRLRGLLELIIDEERVAARRGHAAGCMVVSSHMTPDVVQRDPRVSQILNRARDHQISLIMQAVVIGHFDGTVTSDVQPRQAALAIIGLISSLRVLAQAGSGPEDLQDVANVTLSALTV